MNLQRNPPEQRLRLFQTHPHECGYLPGRTASTLVADPEYRKSPQVLGALTELGFRRSGAMIYRPHCSECSACVPVRVPVQAFSPRRSQRRVWRTNSDLEVRVRDDGFEAEHFELYRSYIDSRHGDGTMADPTPVDFRTFLTAPWSETIFIEFRSRGELIAVAVSDVLPDAWSAVYAFFTPDQTRRSLGVYCVLWQINALRRARRKWLYLGYWIEQCRKMSYKSEYRPQQHFGPHGWTEER
ncbi:MAG: arginyltransferase [Gammaproteobacteria bacterium]